MHSSLCRPVPSWRAEVHIVDAEVAGMAVTRSQGNVSGLLQAQSWQDWRMGSGPERPIH
jgi:hypothetical protein